MRTEPLRRPLSIDSVRDGAAYILPPGSELVTTNLFFKVGQIDELFIKVPSERGLADYRALRKAGEANPELRGLEHAERFERLPAELERFPDLKRIVSLGDELAHYLLIHRLQHERVQHQDTVRIPSARFGALRFTKLGLVHRFEPAIFQERMPGTTLWHMFDFAALRVTSRWRPFLPEISRQLARLLGSDLKNHIDWNIQNFVFDERTSRLAYVDVKPTIFLSRDSNEQNLKGIRDYFLA